MAHFSQQARRIAWPSCDRGRSQSPSPAITRLPHSAPLSRFIEALERDGCVVIQDFTDQQTVDKAKQEVQPWLDKEDGGAVVGALQGRTKTVTRLIGRSATIREKFYADELHQALCEHFLALETTHWYGKKPLTTVSHPLLSISIAFDIPPGTSSQGLHRDDKNHHARHTAVDTYEKGRDVLLGLFVPAVDTTKANGATRVVPGSHLWGDNEPDFGSDGKKGVVDAELEVGEALIFLGSLYHGGGSYKAPLGLAKEGGRESRTIYAMFSCSGVSRQEEISFLSYPIDEVRTYSPIVQERLGWKQSEPNLGWVDLKSPEFLLQS